MTKVNLSSNIDPNLKAEIERIVRYVVNEIVKKNPSYEHYKNDLIQEGMVKALESFSSFDPSKSNLNTFISRCVRNELINYLKGFFKISPNTIDDISEVMDIPDPRSNKYEFLMIEKEILDFISKNPSLFTEDDKEIFILWMEGFKYKEIARKVGKSKKYIDNSIQKTKKIIMRNFKL